MELRPDFYPIDRHLEEIKDSLLKRNTLLIKAQTGAGKTTRLPPYLCEQLDENILVLEPRRLAAKLSAKRCRDLIGDKVGHHIRFDKSFNDQTKLLFITEGLFLPYLREDSELKKYSTIIIDEFHERSIHTDIALALIRHLQRTTRPDLKLIVMSATLDTTTLEKYLEGPKIFDIEGRVFPISIEYKNSMLSEAIEQMSLDPRCPRNILVFLSGMGEIRKLESELKDQISDMEIIPLHSTLSKKEQDKAFKGDNRKIILSTNIAETSLTIPNITGVVDSGFERRASFAPWSGMPILQKEKISKASATQRAGRAGRVQEGIVYRIYNQVDFNQRENFTPPEIKRIELSHTVLDLISLGINPRDLNWFEVPEEKNLNRAFELLELIGALKEEEITKKGQYIADLPLHPRLGALLYKEQSEDLLLCACILSEGNIYSKNVSFTEHDDDKCDLSIQCDLLKAHYHNDKRISDYTSKFLDYKKAKRVLSLYEPLSRRLKLQSISNKKTNPRIISHSLLDSYPDRVAKKREIKNKGKSRVSYNFCLGRGGILSYNTVTSITCPDYLIVLDALENPKANAATGTSLQMASSILREDLLKSDSTLLNTVKESIFNEKKGTVKINTLTKYANLTIKEELGDTLIPKGETLINLMKENWPWPFENDEELKLYNKRVSLLNASDIEHQCPEFEGEMLELFFESIIEESTDFQSITKTGLKNLIYDQLSPQDVYTLDQNSPFEISLENKKKFKIFYDEDRPYIKARIQDLYSVKKHPHICDGKISLTLKLLSPANRVAQVCGDINSFWENSWDQVRKDLKSRYPKHYWPDNPKESEPIRVKKN